MNNVKQKWHIYVLVVLIIAYIITFSTLSILRHNSFNSKFDLGNMDQTVWNTLHGRIFTLTNYDKNVSRLAIHTDFALILFAPFYLIWSSPHMLNILESVYLALGAIPVFLIAGHVLKKKYPPLIFAAIYLLNPLVEWVDIFDFHAVSLSIPLILSAFYFALKKNWKWYFIAVLLALFTKEDVSLQVALLGFIVAFYLKQKKEGLITFIAGIVWFVTMVFVVMPAFNPQGKHWAFAWFNPGSIKSVIDRIFFNREIRTYYTLLFKSFGLLPVFGLPWLILAMPTLLVNILSSHDEMHLIQYHYTSGLIPGLILASIYGVNFLSKLSGKIGYLKKYSAALIGLGVFTALLIVMRVNYHYSPLPTTAACLCDVYKVTQDDREFERVLRTIPSSVSVTATYEIRPHVSQREFSYSLPYASDSADFIALIKEKNISQDPELKSKENLLIDKLFTRRTYSLYKKIGRFYLLKKADYP